MRAGAKPFDVKLQLPRSPAGSETVCCCRLASSSCSSTVRSPAGPDARQVGVDVQRPRLGSTWWESRTSPSEKSTGSSMPTSIR